MSDNEYDNAKQPFPDSAPTQSPGQYVGDIAGAMVEKSLYETGFGRNRQPPVRKMVELQIIELERQIKERKDLLEALDANKGVEDVLDKMRKLHL